MEKRYQVFVSSTYEDLQEERKEVIQALLELDCIPAGMELFPASNDDQWTLIKSIIDDSDYYILILGGRYGSTNGEGISYTEMEYQYALDSGKPIIAFLHKNPDNITAGKTEASAEGKEKLKTFRELVQKKMTKYWTNPDDLGSVVSRGMIKLIKSNPAVGWVKADNVADEYSMKEILKLKKENEELKGQIETNRKLPPRGSENLSQGDECVDITFIARWSNEEYESYIDEIDCQVTWNDLFRIISPHLLSVTAESTIKKLIVNYVKSTSDKDLREIASNKDFSEFSSFNIDDQDFQKVKVQFKALGLIKQNDKQKFWILTEYGEYIMTQLVAIKL